MSKLKQQEKVRIDELFKEGKISTQDHKILNDALENRKTKIQNFMNWVFNPFIDLSTTHALLIGAIVVLLLSFFGNLAQIYFPGALDVQVIQNGKRAYSLLDLLIQNLIAVATLSGVFYVVSLAFRQKNLRFIDFLGYISFSRYPYAIFVALMFLLGSLNEAFLPRTSEVQEGSLEVIVLASLSIPAVVWQMVLLFKAFKTASGLKAKSLWISFILGIVISETLSIGLNSLIFK